MLLDRQKKARINTGATPLECAGEAESADARLPRDVSQESPADARGGSADNIGSIAERHDSSFGAAHVVFSVAIHVCILALLCIFVVAPEVQVGNFRRYIQLDFESRNGVEIKNHDAPTISDDPRISKSHIPTHPVLRAPFPTRRAQANNNWVERGKQTIAVKTPEPTETKLPEPASVSAQEAGSTTPYVAGTNNTQSAASAEKFGTEFGANPFEEYFGTDPYAATYMRWKIPPDGSRVEAEVLKRNPQYDPHNQHAREEFSRANYCILHSIQAQNSGDENAAVQFRRKADEAITTVISELKEHEALLQRECPDELFRTYGNLAESYAIAGDAKKAIEYHRMFCDSRPSYYQEPYQSSNLASILLWRGQVEIAKGLFQRTLSHDEHGWGKVNEGPVERVLTLEMLSHIARLQGNIDESQKFKSEALALRDGLNPSSKQWLKRNLIGKGVMPDAELLAETKDAGGGFVRHDY